MTEPLLCPYTDDLNRAFCNSPPQSCPPGIMLDRSCSCHPTLPRSRGAKIKLMNSRMQAGGTAAVCCSLVVSEHTCQDKMGSGKTWNKTKQKVPDCSLANAKQLYNSKNHYSWSLNWAHHIPWGEHGSKKLININTSILPPGEQLSLGKKFLPWKKLLQRDRTVNFPSKSKWNYLLWWD